MIFSGVIQPEYEAIVKDMNIEAEMRGRKKLSLEEYEEIHENKRSPDQSILDGKKEFVLVEIKNTPETKGERRYVFNE